MSSAQNVNLLLGLVAIVAVASTLLSMVSLLWVTRRRRKLADHTPPVTIFKPLKGLDEELEENLRSFFQLDYPTYQLLFCVADADDPAIAVVQKLLAEFPDHDAQLVVGCPAFGLNPKVESLAAMDRYRKHDVILISDSNVRVRPSYLRETACYLAEPGVGLVTNLFAGVGESALRRGAWRTSSSTGSSPAGVALASVLRVTCVVGKSMLMPVRVLEAIGGFAARPQPAGRGPGDRRAGPQGGLLDPAEPPRHRERQPPPRASRWFLNRHSRWYKIRRQMALARLHGRADGQPGDGRAGLGVLGRLGHRLGRPARAWSAWAWRATPSRPAGSRGSFPEAAAPALQPGQGPLAAARLVRRDRQHARPVARAIGSWSAG